MKKHEEDDLQKACVKWFDLQFPKTKGLLFHPANGGSRGLKEAVRLKAQGVRAGVADLVFLYNETATFIELKVGKNKQTDSQKEWQELVESHGFSYHVCRSLEEFMEIIRTATRRGM
jgi:sulfur relay (sulfurtransferase) complex TusBCD TusD component (DsrE family)